jgi:hypothetical protein
LIPQLYASLEEKLVENADGIIGGPDLVTDSAGVGVDLMIVATWLALITKEVELIEVLLNKLKAVALVPALGEDIE